MPRDVPCWSRMPSIVDAAIPVISGTTWPTSVLVTAPEPLRSQRRPLSTVKLIDACLRFRPDTANLGDPSPCRQTVIALDRYPSSGPRRRSPRLEEAARRAHRRCGSRDQGDFRPGTRHRLRAARRDRRQPRPAPIRSSVCPPLRCRTHPSLIWQTNGHHLHRGGDRSGNPALHIAVVVRPCYDPRSRDYATRRTAQGKSMPEIIRRQERYLAREVFTALRADYAVITT